MLEVGGGDIEKIREGFRLQKWERSAQKPSADMVDTAELTPDASTDFNSAVTAEMSEPSAPDAGQGKRRIKRGQSLGM